MNDTEKMVLDLHAAGKSIPDIAARIGRRESTVYMYLSRNGLSPSKSKKNRQQGISSWRIKQVRRKAQEGKRMRVESVKAFMFGDIPARGRNGMPVLARVVSAASEYFCLVELPGGTRECILWIDMVGESLDRY